MGVLALIGGSSILATLILEISEGRANPVMATLDGCTTIIGSGALMRLDGLI